MKEDDVKYSPAMKDIPPDDRPREKALKYGVEVLSPSELLAIVLGSGVHGEPVIKLSQRILAGYDNNIQKLASSSVGELKRKFKGIGNVKAITILAALRLAEFSRQAELPAQICSPQAAYEYIKSKMGTPQHEEFWIMSLSRSKRVLAATKISQGGVSSTTVDPKIVLKAALDNLASSIILFHNHPSGNCMPSGADDAITQKIQRAASYLDIAVDDHIIVCANDFFSYMEAGKM